MALESEVCAEHGESMNVDLKLLERAKQGEKYTLMELI